MKTIKLIILFTLIILSQLNAQTTPITKKVNGSYTKYWTTSNESCRDLYESQSDEHKKRVKNEVKIIDALTGNDLDACFSTKRLNDLADIGKRMKPLLYFDQTGKVCAAGLLINTNYYTVTDEEVQCILTKLMNKKLQLKFLNGIFNFYYFTDGTYRPTQGFVNPHEDPDLPEDQH